METSSITKIIYNKSLAILYEKKENGITSKNEKAEWENGKKIIQREETQKGKRKEGGEGEQKGP